MTRLRVLLADDHPIVLQGLRALVDQAGHEVIGEATNGHDAVRMAEQLRPDLAIMDIGMPLLNGVDAARQIMKASGSTRTILLSVHDELPYVVESLRAGVTGYLVKTRTAEDLVQAIREVSRGGVYLSPSISREATMACLSGRDNPEVELSPREREVLQLVAEGKTTKEAAVLLGISVKTAESHRARIMEKLDLHGTAELVRYAIRQGLIEA